MESMTSMPKVKGMSSATPIVAERPGRKPKMIPATVPTKTRMMVVMDIPNILSAPPYRKLIPGRLTSST